MYYYRKLLQFNDLVIDNHSMLLEEDISLSFKGNNTEIVHSNGDYRPFTRDYNFTSSQTVSCTLTFNLKKMLCEDRENYIKFATNQLVKKGILWSIKNNRIQWARAVCDNYGESVDRLRDKLIINVDFNLYEGVWHYADEYSTFLKPYEACNVLDCVDYPTKLSCVTCSSCSDLHSCYTIQNDLCDCCRCETVTKEQSLCYMRDSLQNFYKNCGDTYKIVYDRQRGEEFFGNKFLGQKFCSKDSCTETIGCNVYNEGELPTDSYTIILEGELNRPSIEVNGNINHIDGVYNGVLIINSDGSVYYKTDCCTTLLPMKRWQVPKVYNDNGDITSRMSRGFEFQPKDNQVIIRTGVGGDVCAYFYLDSITI